MILKDYQNRALATVQTFVQQLAEWREKDWAAQRLDPDWGFDWVQRAWEKTVPTRPYNPRRNGLGERLPAFCLKIPTGGGKTLLATRVIDIVNARFRGSRRGLVLWIVPTQQIYDQTLRALRDRDHPYRQNLDLTSGQRTHIFEKTATFGPSDVSENLCILLLMLPSANRRTRDTLRIFRDSGGFDEFFPADDDPVAHKKLLDEVPNLDTFEHPDGFWGRLAKTSLGNTVRLLNPLVILDEGHKAYSDNAKATLEGFNPCMIVELSATPASGANVLVEILGLELHAEEMIKLDLHVINKSSGDWKDTLFASIDHRERLEIEANRHIAESGTYIRPLCVIQVERTGAQQRRPGYIHAEDVRESLLRHPGIKAEHVAIKTSSKNELKDVDDVGGLLSRDCPIRFIITKQALQEGWDCPFAYVLTILTNPQSKTGITQLVGRILRQPYARKTGVPLLDESYVFCFSRRGTELLKEIRKGFGLEGLQGLEGKVVTEVDSAASKSTIRTSQRSRFRASTRNLVLPAFVIRDEDGWRPVHYEADILSRVPWDDLTPPEVDHMHLGEGIYGDVKLLANLTAGVRVMPPAVTEENLIATAKPDGPQADPGLELSNCFYYATSHLVDLISNPWRGHEIVRCTFEALLERYPVEIVLANQVFVLESLRRHVEDVRDRLSREVFHSLLNSGEMRFLVVAENLEFNRIPGQIDVPSAKRANREDGRPFQRNLFDSTMEDDLNQFESQVATYLDQQEKLYFWYRNRARKDHYVQGWKRKRIYADFIVTMRGDATASGEEFDQIFVVETKGVHLKESEDSNYKRSVFDICCEHAREAKWADLVPAMRSKAVTYEVVDEDEWQEKLNGILGRRVS
ncbi:MAG: restriction endonuclease subunit R [Chloroflexi bacterium]|nr:restriction endonuclease subunit R [Chloroflexota bacterium]